jgi:hypothetical protein
MWFGGYWDLQRILSLTIAIVYIAVGVWVYAPQSGAKLIATIFLMAAALALPLACIWFSDEMAEYYEGSFLHPITAPSSGTLIRLGGWILLVLPVLRLLVIRWILD